MILSIPDFRSLPTFCLFSSWILYCCAEENVSVLQPKTKKKTAWCELTTRHDSPLITFCYLTTNVLAVLSGINWVSILGLFSEEVKQSSSSSAFFWGCLWHLWTFFTPNHIKHDCFCMLTVCLHWVFHYIYLKLAWYRFKGRPFQNNFFCKITNQARKMCLLVHWVENKLKRDL